jgi:hypothetical protein
MQTLRGSAHVLTSRNLRGLRSCLTSTGLPIFKSEAGRLLQEQADLRTRDRRRAWLGGLWQTHLERCAAAKKSRLPCKEGSSGR